MFKVISSLLYTNEGCLHVCFDSTVGPKGPKMCHLDVLSLIILA